MAGGVTAATAQPRTTLGITPLAPPSNGEMVCHGLGLGIDAGLTAWAAYDLAHRKNAGLPSKILDVVVIALGVPLAIYDIHDIIRAKKARDAYRPAQQARDLSKRPPVVSLRA